MTLPHATDICGCPVGLSDATARREWDAMLLAFLAHGQSTPDRLAKVIERAPDFAMAHAAKGLFCLMLGRREMVAVAQAALAAAQGGETTHRREGLWVEALARWLEGRPSETVACMEAALSIAPHDTASAKVSQAIRFILGDAAGMRASAEAVLHAHGPDHPLRGYLLGCHAFALEETGAYAAAEAQGIEALAWAPDDAWGLHAVAHVYDMTAQPDRGIELIEANCAAWDHANNFRYHVWWHKALLHLDRDEPEVALELYDTQIRADRTDDYRDIANATSLLLRLELEGHATGSRWDELAALAEARSGDGMLVFADLHYMLALSRSGDTRDALAPSFASRACDTDEMARRYADPGTAALAGLHAFAEGRYGVAFDTLAAARGQMQTIGGSHAQRDVFERMTIDAGLRAGRLEATETILRDRRDLRAGHDDRFARSRFAALQAARRIAAE